MRAEEKKNTVSNSQDIRLKVIFQVVTRKDRKKNSNERLSLVITPKKNFSITTVREEKMQKCKKIGTL